MADEDVLIGLGYPERLSKNAQARRCHECGGLAYFAPTTLAHMAREAHGRPQRFIHLGCLNPDELSDIKIQPFDDAQIAAVHATGVDMTGDQINSITKDVLEQFVRLKRKP